MLLEEQIIVSGDGESILEQRRNDVAMNLVVKLLFVVGIVAGVEGLQVERRAGGLVDNAALTAKGVSYCAIAARWQSKSVIC